jgi:uncharacterized protein YndB with AHSA1/START domain
MTPASEPRPDTYELFISRTFAAPVALVYRLWAEREHMIRWWGPKNFTCTALEMDFRPGGRWRACIESSRYGRSWMGGTYHSIEPQRRLVFSFAWEDGRDQPGVETLVTVTFTAQGATTLQTFHQTPFLHAAGRDSHVLGWNSSFDCEAEYGSQLAGAAP